MALAAIRYGIPAALIIAGIVVGAVTDSVAGAALFFSAGSAVLLLNVLYRIGVQGDKERDREDEARAYFDEHGHWPD
jgi:hypothetical protein